MTTTTGSTFSGTLAAHRRRRGLSQTRLARAAGVDRSFVSRLESNDRTPSRATVQALAVGLDLTHNQGVGLLVLAGYLPTLTAVQRETILQILTVGPARPVNREENDRGFPEF